ncbi:hypothetical protein CY0110_16307 [Crocosphaera chwakensis CCY0110]|uniref:Uncharacterized protein n=1 Tax=Crocosphaera chwakensis CCY0110 TaxID=391612 RepID=A3IHU3_9CHRO|nr:hypothetical protein CY0110_16307 [Crocosphaera chwakensis CCY0110]
MIFQLPIHHIGIANNQHFQYLEQLE